MELAKIWAHLEVTPKLGLAYLMASIAFLVAAKAVYNIYFHPLSKYPGPLHLVVSDIPLAVVSLLGTAAYTLKDAHDKYGEIVRIGPGTLSYINPQAWTDIYGYKKGGGGVANFPKDPTFYSEMLLGKDTITLVNDNDAIPIRRSLNAAFAHRSLLEQEPMMRRHVDQLMAQFEKHSAKGHPVDVREWFTYSTFDINSDFGFGDSLECVNNGVYHPWAKFIIEYFYAATLLHQCHKFWPLNRVLAFCISPEMRKTQASHSAASLERVRTRMAMKTDRHDFMHYFLKQAEKEKLSTSIIEAQATVVILAGSETSALASIAALFYTLTNRHIHKRLQEEVRAAFSSLEDIKLQDVARLPYLNAVVQETLRLRAPLANGFPRWVSDRNGAIVCGKFVPQNTVLMIHHYASNTSALNFRDPMSFVPERWLGDTKYSDDRRDVVQPFSVGPRNCPGQQFANYIIRLTLATLLWRFDLTLAEGTEDWAEGQRLYSGWVQPPLPVLMARRA